MHGLGGWASLKLDPLTGGIVGLASSRSNQTWATPANPLGVLTYQSLTEDDYKGWRKDYLAVDCDTEYGKLRINRDSQCIQCTRSEICTCTLRNGKFHLVPS